MVDEDRLDGELVELLVESGIGAKSEPG